MKKGDISIEFTFLIFLAVIVVMVIITLIIKFAFSGSTIFCKIVGTCDKEKPPVPDNQLINLSTSNCDRVRTELVKHAKLCYARALDLVSREVTICYTLISPGGCPFTQQDINDDMLNEDINGTMFGDPSDTKFVVTFNRKEKSINIV
ncbi:MAG TPA: hypothetical protein VJB90_02155 [Candidatus Nanoarchaeia archaeon]|nr:hypothetical protein [Candidatus Nanoarchaeia archaeon]